MDADRRVTVSGFEGEDRRANHKCSDDPRHRPVGRFLRRNSLDELPQLINVVLGDMVLIGPRPELPEVVAGYEPWQHERFSVKPGLTGLWQVTARGDGKPMQHHVGVDIYYARNVNLKLDFAIVRATASAMRKGS